MAEQPRGRPPGTASPPVARGRNALTALGGGVLVLAVAGGAWVLFGREGEKGTTAAVGPTVSTSAPGRAVIGPVAPKPAATPSVRATSVGPVAPGKPAAVATTAAPAPAKAAPKPAVPATAAPTKAPTTTAAAPPPAAATVAGAQQQGTVAQKAYTFRVARGDTLWGYTLRVLHDTGRPTSNATVASFVAALYSHNRGVIGSDPNLIVPGQTITWPAGV